MEADTQTIFNITHRLRKAIRRHTGMAFNANEIQFLAAQNLFAPIYSRERDLENEMTKTRIEGLKTAEKSNNKPTELSQPNSGLRSPSKSLLGVIRDQTKHKQNAKKPHSD